MLLNLWESDHWESDLWESDLWESAFWESAFCESAFWELAKLVRLYSCGLLTFCRLCELCLLDLCELRELDLCELTRLDLCELTELDLSEFTERCILCLNLRASDFSTPSFPKTPLCKPPFNILSLCEMPSLKRDT